MESCQAFWKFSTVLGTSTFMSSLVLLFKLGSMGFDVLKFASVVSQT